MALYGSGYARMKLSSAAVPVASCSGQKITALGFSLLLATGLELRRLALTVKQLSPD